MAWDPAVEPNGGDDAGQGGADSPSTMPLAEWASGADNEPTRPSGAGAPAEPTLPAGRAYGPPSYGPPGYMPPGYVPPGYGPAGYGPPGYGHPGYVPPGYAPGYGPGYGQPGMRAAAADRERTIDVLKAAYGEGRLTRDEFEARTARTMAAKYYGELAAIVGDLPAGPHLVPAPPPGYYPPPAQVPPTNGLAVGSLVCSLVGMLMPLMLVPGLVMGHVARDQIRTREQRGDGLAVAGLVFGYLGLAFWALILVVVASHS